MKRLALILLPLVLAGLAVAVVRHYSRTRGDAGSAPLTIHFTCDTSGRLEPCGCFSGQHGGLTRLKSWLDQRNPSGPTLKLDVGGAIAGPNDYDLIQYRYITRAYAAMDFAALNMGTAEAAVPPATLTELAASSPVPLISASIVDAATRQPILPASRIVNIAGKRIGILGVLSPRSVPSPAPGLSILDLNEAIDRELPALRRDADLLILLAFAGETELSRLAGDYFEFALILGGDVAGPAQKIIRENESIILYTTNEARTVGTLTAGLSAGPVTRLLDPAYEIQLLWDVIPQSDELRGLVAGYRDEIRHTPLAIDDPAAADPNAIPGVAATATYVGSASCKTCHPAAHDTWLASGHAHAFQTLVEKGSDADPHCIQCHTVGFGRPGGYRRPMGSASLTDVGCESCHGPASEHLARHVEGKLSSFKFRPLGPGDCTVCHQGEFSRPFAWDDFWPSISHGK